MLGRVSPLTGVPNYHAVVLSWGAVTDATSYTVSWRATNSSTYRSVQTSGTSLVVTGLVAGQPYAFTVRPTRGVTLGPATPELVVTPTGTVTAAPPPPALSRVPGHRVRVRWQQAVGATSYHVFVRRTGRTWHSLGWTTGTRVTSKRLAAHVRYAFKVQPWHQLVPGHVSAPSRIRAR